jgi:hypothetical protein
MFVQPETVIRWQREERFRRFWARGFKAKRDQERATLHPGTELNHLTFNY